MMPWPLPQKFTTSESITQPELYLQDAARRCEYWVWEL